MKHRLNHYRSSYDMWRRMLGKANQNQAPKHVRAQIMRNLNRSRKRLKDEMNRVAWLLWPETGRPYMGEWQVTRPGSSKFIFQGSMISCINFINNSRYGLFYRITKPINP